MEGTAGAHLHTQNQTVSTGVSLVKNLANTETSLNIISPSTNCPLPNSESWCEPEGRGSLGVLILGEAMGEAEARDHLPFRPYAEAGALLERAINRCGWRREQFVLYNAIPTHPFKNYIAPGHEAAAIEWGRPYVQKVIDDFKPRCILALGATPLRATTQLDSISHSRGWAVPGRLGIPVVPAFHPAFIRRGALPLFSDLMHCLKLSVAVANTAPGRTTKFFSPVLWRDFEYTAPDVLPDPFNPRVPAGYLLHPTEDVAYQWLKEEAEHAKLIAYDIETPRSHNTAEDETDELGETRILSIQFSTAPRTGIFLPWRDPFVDVAKAVLALPCAKAGANTWRFDDPLLAAHHMRINGELHDIRWAFHHLQPDLKSALDFVSSFYCPVHEGWGPWKHMHESHKEFYGIRDVDAVQWIAQGVESGKG